MICSKGSVPAVVCLFANRVLHLTAGDDMRCFSFVFRYSHRPIKAAFKAVCSTRPAAPSQAPQ